MSTSDVVQHPPDYEVRSLNISYHRPLEEFAWVLEQLANCLFVFLGLIILRAVSLAVLDWITLPIVLFGGLLVTIAAIRNRPHDISSYVFLIPCFCCFWALLHLVRELVPGGWLPILLFAVSLVLIVLAANRIATNYAHLRASSPRLRDEQGEEWFGAWLNRFNNPLHLRVYERRSAEAWLSVAIATTALLSAIFLATVTAGHGNFWFLHFILWATLLLVLACVASMYSLIDAEVQNPFGIAWHALRVWFCYNIRSRHADGTYESPYGHHRFWITTAALYLLATSALINTRYFPVVMNISPELAWVTAPKDTVLADPVPPPRLAGRPSDAGARLSPAETRYLQSIKHMPALYRDRVRLFQRESAAGILASQRAKATDDLFGQPESWFLVAFRRMLEGNVNLLTTVFCSVLLSVVLPVVFMYALVLTLIGRTVPLFEVRLHAEEQTGDHERKHYIRRLAESSIKEERESVLLGFSEPEGDPILAPRELHTLIQGSTRARKTSKGIIPRLDQAIVQMNPRLPHVLEQPSQVILDLKGDWVAFQKTRETCKQNGVPFKYVTNAYTAASHGFNPLCQSHLRFMSRYQQDETLLRGMSLYYGPGYPKEFWADINRLALVITRSINPSVCSFAELLPYARDRDLFVQRGGYEDDWKKARGFLAKLYALANYLPLNVSPNTVKDEAVLKGMVDMRSLALKSKQPQVIYFFLSQTEDEGITHSVALLALYTLMTAINTIPLANRRRTSVTLDEAQVVATDILANLFRQAAGLGLTYTLSLQEKRSLPEVLQAVVDENCDVQMTFRANTKETRQQIEEESGLTLYDLHSNSVSHGTNGGTVTRGFTEHIGPVKTKQQVIEESFDNDLAFVKFNQRTPYVHAPTGFTLRTMYAMSHDDYLAYQELPWPDKTPDTVVARDDDHVLHEYLPHIRSKPSAPESSATPVEVKETPPLLDAPEFEACVARHRTTHEHELRCVDAGEPLLFEEGS